MDNNNYINNQELFENNHINKVIKNIYPDRLVFGSHLPLLIIQLESKLLEKLKQKDELDKIHELTNEDKDTLRLIKKYYNHINKYYSEYYESGNEFQYIWRINKKERNP